MTPTNPALKDVEFLIGEWNIELSDASFLPGPNQKINFSVNYEWKADGSVIAVQQKGEEPYPQKATWLIGRDEDEKNYTVLYADTRGVSRVYHMSFKDYTWKMWRNTARFSQRFEGKVSEDNNKIEASWEKSTDKGKTWEHDFNMTYTRN